MSDSGGQSTLKPLGVSPKAFDGLLWAGVAISLVFVLVRVYVRLSVFRRFFADDALVFAAWLMFLVSAILWQGVYLVSYVGVDVALGKIAPPPDLRAQLIKFFHMEIAINLLYTSTLWAIKLSFMMFFRKLGQNVRKQHVLWWAVLVALIAAFAITIGVYNWACLVGSADRIIATCGTSRSQEYTRLSTRIVAGVDVITDALILTVPINLLWNVQMSGRSKMALIGLFSLTLFIMIVSILRAVISIQGGENVDNTWIYTWGFIEQTVAIIIACLVSYRALWRKENRSQHRKATTGSSWQPLRYDNTHRMTHKYTEHAVSVEGGKLSSSFGGEEMMPLDTIHVRQDYGVSPGSRSSMVDVLPTV